MTTSIFARRFSKSPFFGESSMSSKKPIRPNLVLRPHSQPVLPFDADDPYDQIIAARENQVANEAAKEDSFRREEEKKKVQFVKDLAAAKEAMCRLGIRNRVLDGGSQSIVRIMLELDRMTPEQWIVERRKLGNLLAKLDAKGELKPWGDIVNDCLILKHQLLRECLAHHRRRPSSDA
jgi:hypothetical protein